MKMKFINRLLLALYALVWLLALVCVALGLGYGIGSTTAVQGFMPQWLSYVFGGSGIVPAALLAIILNIVIRRDPVQPAE